jgi:hypothetical protein
VQEHLAVSLLKSLFESFSHESTWHPYSDEKSDASSHQMGKGYGDHVGVRVADKNGQAGGGLVNYFGD